MSKLLLCVISVLVVLQAVLTGEHRLAVAAHIGGEFLCQDPIRGPGSSSLMFSHGCGDELVDARAAAPAFTQEEDIDIVIDEEAFSIDKYAGDDKEDEEVLFIHDREHAPDPDRSVDEEEAVEGEDDLLPSVQEADTEVSNDSEEHGSSDSGDVRCRSNKSMFGHLRSHPDRGYKGVTPQPAKTTRHDTPSQPPFVHDDDRPVARYSQRDPNLNKFEILAAYVMLTLKHRDRRIALDQSVNVKREPDAPPEEEGSVVSRAGDSVVLGDRKDTSDAEMALADAVIRSEDSSSAAEMAGDDQWALHSERVVIPTKKRRTKKSKEVHRKQKDVIAGKGRRPYICKHCQAVFPTHQALGGHMAAHNKDWRVQAQNEQAAAAALEAHHHGKNLGNSEEERGRGGLSAAARELLMERDTRLFNQGQQTRQEDTGGYKRQHTESESERMDGGSLPPVAAPVADGDPRRLFGVQALKQE